MQILAIGQPFDPAFNQWPEGCHYNYDDSGHWLHYFYNNPSEQEISSIQRGEALFGLYISGPVIFLLHRFGKMPWNDAPYSWWLVAQEFRKIPEISDELHALLRVVMVDTATGLVVALRGLTFSAEFTRYLHEAIVNQSKQPCSLSQHDLIVREVYLTLSTHDLVRRCEIVCKGGE
ncbi:MAG TPA: hypothetical protein VMC85_12855 [Desulfomonilaceae bacterium]|nr:hypothetical protein [Desulfomonilaceae bacterium]